MKITKEFLEKIGACSNGIEFWEANGKPNNLKDAFKLLLEKEELSYVNWFICQLMSHKQIIQYAIFAAKQVIDIFEKEYPNNKIPREAIEAAEKYLKNPTKKNKDAANAAANAAYAAANAAANAANAANAAANAAYAAAYAAYAAANAAYAAAYAANAAANAAMKLKIIKYGLKLLKIKL